MVRHASAERLSVSLAVGRGGGGRGEEQEEDEAAARFFTWAAWCGPAIYGGDVWGGKAELAAGEMLHTAVCMGLSK